MQHIPDRALRDHMPLCVALHSIPAARPQTLERVRWNHDKLVESKEIPTVERDSFVEQVDMDPHVEPCTLLKQSSLGSGMLE